MFTMGYGMQFKLHCAIAASCSTKNKARLKEGKISQLTTTTRILKGGGKNVNNHAHTQKYVDSSDFAAAEQDGDSG